MYGCLNRVILQPVYLQSSKNLLEVVHMLLCARYSLYSHLRVISSQPNPPPPGALGCKKFFVSLV